MDVAELDYYLPRSAIAQYPLAERDASRMMVIKKEERAIYHHQFRDLCTFLRAGDVLVVNDSRVIPARLYGLKETGGKVELLLLKRISEMGHGEIWEAMVKPARRVREGTVIHFGDDALAQVVERVDEKNGASFFRTWQL